MSCLTNFLNTRGKKGVYVRKGKELAWDNILCLFRNWVLALLRMEFGDLYILCKTEHYLKNASSNLNSRSISLLIPRNIAFFFQTKSGRGTFLEQLLQIKVVRRSSRCYLISSRYTMLRSWEILLRCETKYIMKKLIFLHNLERKQLITTRLNDSNSPKAWSFD